MTKTNGSRFSPRIPLLMPLVAAFGLLLPGAPARAETKKFDASMKPLVAPYLAIHKALAADSEKGVAAAARKLVKLAGKVDAGSVSGKHKEHYKGIPAKIKAAAGELAEAKGIKARREAFKKLSRPLAMWVTMSEPEGLSVVFCSMAKGSWLQRDKPIANPYYGKEMLRCGEVVAGKNKGMAGGHMKKGNHEKGHGGHGH